MATVEFRYDPKNTAWFTANAAMVLKAGEPAYHDTTGLFKLGDGVTALSALSFLPIVSSSTPTIQQVLTTGNVATTTIETTGFIKTGGTSAQFLKADGTVDSNVYGVGDALTTNPLSQFAATTSSQLAGVISDETGTGALVFGTSPSFTTNITTPLIYGSSASGGTLLIDSTSNATKGVMTFGSASSSNLYQINTGSGANHIKIQGTVGDTTSPALYFNQSSPSSSNYSIASNGGNLVLNAASANNILFLNVGNSQIVTVKQRNILFSPINTGVPVLNFEFAIAATTGQSASVNAPQFKVTGNTIRFNTGALATQYFNYFTANTVSFVGASTATNVYNLFVEAPIQGTNATITNNYAAGFQGNIHQLDNGTNGIKFQPLVGGTTYSAIYMNQATPSGNNYTLACGGTDTYIRGTASLSLVTNQAIISISTTQVTTTDSINYSFGTTTGTKLGTATTQKISFWNATPIVQPTAVSTVQGFYNAMSSIGLIASGTITLPTGYAKSINNIAINTTAGATGNTDYYYFCTSTLTLTLPTAIGNTNTYNIKLTSGSLTINTTSSQTIDGSLTITTSILNTSFTVISDGTNWQII
jgi:hypothetical protein